MPAQQIFELNGALLVDASGVPISAGYCGCQCVKVSCCDVGTPVRVPIEVYRNDCDFPGPGIQWILQGIAYVIYDPANTRWAGSVLVYVPVLDEIKPLYLRWDVCGTGLLHLSCDPNFGALSDSVDISVTTADLPDCMRVPGFPGPDEPSYPSSPLACTEGGQVCGVAPGFYGFILRAP